ncbi:MAG: hypothetical protein AAGK04_08700, partial [Planctomycetota bacterium]
MLIGRTVTGLSSAALAACLCIATHTQAQTGRGLDRPLYRPLDAIPGQANVAPRRSFADEIRFRNAIVTGNAPGGRSFRGDVGYTAPFEFRGELSTDDNFAFRRDAFFGGLAGVGIRGTDALQYQFALTTGSSVPPALAGALSFGRGGGEGAAGSLAAAGFMPGVGAPALQPLRPGAFGQPGPGDGLRVPTEPIATPPIDGLPDRSEPGALAAGFVPSSPLPTLRSTAAFTSVRTLRPELLGYGDGGRERVVASSLGGVQLQRNDDFADDRRPDNRFAIASPTAVESAAASRPDPTAGGTAYGQAVARLAAISAIPTPNPTGAPSTGQLAGVDAPTGGPNADADLSPQDAALARLAPWQRRLVDLQQQLGDLEREASLTNARTDAQAARAASTTGMPSVMPPE